MIEHQKRQIDEMLVQVSLEAFTPFIPLNADDSGIPGAYFQCKVKNPGRERVEVSITGSMNNSVGFEGYNDFSFMQHVVERVNENRDEKGIRGITYTGRDFSDRHITWAENSNFSFLHFTDRVGSLSVTHSLEPGKEKIYTFILSWP